MDPKLVALFYLAALVCFAAGAFGYERKKLSLIPIGLGLWLFPTLYVAAQAAGFLPK